MNKIVILLSCFILSTNLAKADNIFDDNFKINTEEKQNNDILLNQLEGSFIYDYNIFLKLHYRKPNWIIPKKYKDIIIDNIIQKDYLERKNKLLSHEDIDDSIQVDMIDLVDDSANEIIVESRLPDDCDNKGCLGQIYEMVSENNWKKIAEFKNNAIFYLRTDKNQPALIGSMGYKTVPPLDPEVVPSYILEYINGKYEINENILR